MNKRWKYLLIIFLAIGLFSAGYAVNNKSAVPISMAQNVLPKVNQEAVTSPSIDVYELWTLINAERVNAGLQPLKMNPLLSQSAQAKCDDMVSKNYWAHTSPTGVEPWAFINAQGVKYNKAGENLAFGHKDTSTTAMSWMSSEVHRKEILDPVFTETGLAKCKSTSFLDNGAQVIVVQHFILPK